MMRLKMRNTKSLQRAAALPLVLTLLVIATIGLSFFLKDSELFRISNEMDRSRVGLELKARSNFNAISNAVMSTIESQIIASSGSGVNVFDPEFCNPTTADTCLQPDAIMARLPEFAEDFAGYEFSVSCQGQGEGISERLRCDTFSDSSPSSFPKVFSIDFRMRDPENPSVEVRGSAVVSFSPTTLNAYSGLFYDVESINFGSGRWRGQMGAFLSDSASGEINFRVPDGELLVFEQPFVTNAPADSANIDFHGSTVQFQKGARFSETGNVSQDVGRAFDNALANSSKTAIETLSVSSDPLTEIQGSAPAYLPAVTAITEIHKAELEVGKSGSGSACQTNIRSTRSVEATYIMTMTDLPADPSEFSAFTATNIASGGTAYRADSYPVYNLWQTYGEGHVDYDGEFPHIVRAPVALNPDGTVAEYSPWMIRLKLEVPLGAAQTHTISDAHTVDLRGFSEIYVKPESTADQSLIQVCNRGLSFVADKGPFVLGASLTVGDADEASLSSEKNTVNTAFIRKHTQSEMADFVYPTIILDADRTKSLVKESGVPLSLRELKTRADSTEKLAFVMDAKVIGAKRNGLTIEVDDDLLNYNSTNNPAGDIGRAVFNGGQISGQQPNFRRIETTNNTVVTGFASADMNFSSSSAPGVNTAVLAQISMSVVSFKLSTVDLNHYMSDAGLSWGTPEVGNLDEYEVDFANFQGGGFNMFNGVSSVRIDAASTSPTATGGGTTAVDGAGGTAGGGTALGGRP